MSTAKWAAATRVAVCLLMFFAVRAGLAQTPTSQPTRVAPVNRDLAEYRSKYPTTLTRHGPPPQAWQDPTPLAKPDGVEEVEYESEGMKLKAWVSDIPQDGKLHPAVVFCHGGFWFGNDDWAALKPFLDAGFVVMAPRVRGENGNPGDLEYYYGEVNDVVAAGNWLSDQKGVDPKRLFVSGHSAGGDLATLAVMLKNPFAASAPVGAMLDMRAGVRAKDDRHRALIVFDPSNIHEVEARTAMLFTGSLRSPITLYHGDKDWGTSLQKQFVQLAHFFKRQATLVSVPGNHGESLTNAIPLIVQQFQSFDAK